MQTLLIADNNEVFLQQLSQAFLPYYRVLCCNNGRDALALLQQETCDCLLLDLMLPELDGLTLLETAVSLDIRPVVLVISPLFTQYILESAEALGVAYMIRKPCTVQTIVSRMLDLRRHLRPAWASPETIRRFLLWLGIPASCEGFPPCVEALTLFAEDPTQPITKVLYPEVARRLCCGELTVERNIRSAIEQGWKLGDTARWQRYFPERTARPSNKQFFARTLEALRCADWE